MALVSRKNEERKLSPAVVPLAAKMWLLNSALWMLPLQCPTSSFSKTPDAGNQIWPISADPTGLECFTRERQHVGKETLLPCSHPAVATGGSLFSRQTYKTLPTAACCWTGHIHSSLMGISLNVLSLGWALILEAIESGLKVQGSIVH